MSYVLITKDGKIIPFYLKALADIYYIAYGGTLITESECAELFQLYKVDFKE